MKMKIPNYYQFLAEKAEIAREVIAASSDPKNTQPGVDVAHPFATLKNAMETCVTDKILWKGITVMRITSRGVWKQRVVTLAKDKLAFFVTHNVVPPNLSSTVASALPIPFWTPSKGFQWSNDGHRYIRHLDVADIDAWQVGVIDTMILEYARHSIKDRQICELVTVFHHGFNPICFRVPNKQHRQAFVKALQLMKDRYNLMVSFISREQVLLRYISYDVDIDKNRLTSSAEFAELCKRINLVLPDRDKLFADFAKKAHGSKNSREINSAETRQLLQTISLQSMPAARVWDEVFGKETESVGPGQLREFLLVVQKESTISMAEVELLMKSIKTAQDTEDTYNRICKQEFLEFLMSKFNDAYDPAERLPPTTKLDEPISHYWINTSHNTYLTGDQLKSRSSVEAYVIALYRGCKCLELDCWDGYEDKEGKKFVPLVYHGYTLTSKIDFGSILLVTEKYLSENPESYPIILSLENHCSNPYQKSMAEQLKKVFGKKLYSPSKEELAGEFLPSPEQLRGMVVIKGKRPPEEDDEAVMKDGKKMTAGDSRLLIDDNGVDDYDDALKNTTHMSKIDHELSVLTLLHGCKYKDFSKSVQQPHGHMHSIGETKFTKILDKSSENAQKWREYNSKHMTRTYPAGVRIDSSNYNPVPAWAVGCQLVALNFQTSDSPLILNDGRFRQSGGCGYILKPASVMGRAKPTETSIRICVLSAYCLPKPRGARSGEVVDPYIKVELHDIRQDENKKEVSSFQSFKTPSVDNNGFCPVWKDADFIFDIANPDVAMLLFKIVDEDYDADDIICSSAIPVSCLRKGYRSLQLYDDHGKTTGPFECATIFVKIE